MASYNVVAYHIGLRREINLLFMNKWIVTYKDNNICMDFLPPSYLLKTIGSSRFYYQEVDKFVHDRFYGELSGRLILSDGIILNLAELMQSYSVTSLKTVIEQLLKNDDLFFKAFRGPFTGAMYVEKEDRLIVYGNQTGDAPVFYSLINESVIVSNDFNLIAQSLKENKTAYSFDEDFALSIMTFGYTIDDKTAIKEIKRLSPATMLSVENDALRTQQYYSFIVESKEVSFECAIDLLNDSFRQAVKRCFEKDREYNVKHHLSDMSGGLDSRMTTWVAKDLGYKGICNINYCQSGSDELECASLASKYLGNQFIHKQLDDASFLYEIDEIVKLNYGLAIYSGLTGGKQLLESLNPEIFGLEHTGQLGDVIIDSYFGNNNESPKADDYSKRYSSTIKYFVPEDILNSYHTREEFTFINRGLRGVLSTHLTRRHYFYTVSPFIDPDFINLCFSLPAEYRCNHKLYWAWIDKYYPEAGKVKSTRHRGRMRTIIEACKRKGLQQLHIVGHQIGLPIKKNVSNHMNPFDYWYETDPQLRKFIQQYYDDYSALLMGFNDTYARIESLIKSNRTIDKLLALTVISTFKAYFCSEDL